MDTKFSVAVHILILIWSIPFERLTIDETNRLNILVNDILELSKLQNNKETLNIGVNANGLVQLFELKEIEEKMPAESTSINISVDSASVVQSQTGESPI